MSLVNLNLPEKRHDFDFITLEKLDKTFGPVAQQPSNTPPLVFSPKVYEHGIKFFTTKFANRFAPVDNLVQHKGDDRLC